MDKLDKLLPFAGWGALLLVMLILVLAILKSELETTRIEATLLSQGVGANSIRCALNKDDASCALATHETMASPVTPDQPEDQVPKQE